MKKKNTFFEKIKNNYFQYSHKYDNDLKELLKEQVDIIFISSGETYSNIPQNEVEIITPYDIIHSRNLISSEKTKILMSHRLPTKLYEDTTNFAKYGMIKPLDMRHKFGVWNDCFYYEGSCTSFINLNTIKYYTLIEGSDGTHLVLSSNKNFIERAEEEMEGQMISFDRSLCIKIKCRDNMRDFLDIFTNFNEDLATEIRLLIECANINEDVLFNQFGYGGYTYAWGSGSYATRSM